MSSQLDRIESMLRALCAHLGIQAAAERAGNGSQDAPDSDGSRYTGVVSRFEHGWGFIECEAMNRNFFVHYSDIEGTGMRSLDPGAVVSFELAPGKDGRPKAVRVRRQSGRPSPRVRSLGLPRNDTGPQAFSAVPSPEEASAHGTRGAPSGSLVPDARRLPETEAEGVEASLEDGTLPTPETRPGRK